MDTVGIVMLGWHQRHGKETKVGRHKTEMCRLVAREERRSGE